MWLAEKVGISYSTFRRRLEVAPENLTFRQLHLIASALDVSIEDLILISEGDESAVAS